MPGEALGISPIKQGKRAFVRLDQLRQLDALHEHLAAGGHLHDLATSAIETHPVEEVDESNYSRSNTDAFLTRLVNAAESLTSELNHHRRSNLNTENADWLAREKCCV